MTILLRHDRFDFIKSSIENNWKYTFEMDTRFKLFVVLFLINNVFADEPIVEMNIGVIRGVRSSDGDINMFMGIPYASVNESNPFGVSWLK